jgi:uncharacterized membrane protein YesL
METSGLFGGLYKITEWIQRLAILNLLWIGFTLLGGILFGFFPATTAMFAVVRKWVMGDLEIPVFKTFWSSYKKEFVKSNILGLILSLVAIVLYIDYHFLQASTNEILRLLEVPFLIVTLLFICMLFYVFPIFVHYDMKIKEVIKNSFFIMIMNPISTFIMLLSTSGLLIAMSFAPPLMIVVSGNVIALSIMKPAWNTFNKISRKQEVLLEK